jgi:hypothetical protein
MNNSPIMETKPGSPLSEKNVCSCKHHNAVPVLVVIFAVVFLLQALGILEKSLVDVVWPILVGIAGFFMLGDKRCGCC